MVVGFNHNFRYKGEVYHVQTEDGGLKSPNIVTLLYKAEPFWPPARPPMPTFSGPSTWRRSSRS